MNTTIKICNICGEIHSVTEQEYLDLLNGKSKPVCPNFKDYQKKVNN